MLNVEERLKGGGGSLATINTTFSATPTKTTTTSTATTTFHYVAQTQFSGLLEGRLNGVSNGTRVQVLLLPFGVSKVAPRPGSGSRLRPVAVTTTG